MAPSLLEALSAPEYKVKPCLFWIFCSVSKFNVSVNIFQSCWDRATAFWVSAHWVLREIDGRQSF